MRPGEGSAVEPGAVRPTRDDLDFDQCRAVAPYDPGAQRGARGTLTDQRDVRGYPVTAKCRQVADGLQQVGLALPVGPDERVHPGSKQEVQRRIGPEVHQRQVGEMHVTRTAGSA